MAHKLTEGEGPAWERICELGLGIDPNNELYKPGGEPTSGGTLSRPIPFETGSSFSASTLTLPIQVNQAESPSAVDLDLDLDFSLEDSAPAAISETTSTLSIHVTTKPPSAKDVMVEDCWSLTVVLFTRNSLPVTAPAAVYRWP